MNNKIFPIKSLQKKTELEGEVALLFNVYNGNGATTKNKELY